MRRSRIRLQFSLLTLFGVTTAAALGCAALVYPSPLWASTWFTVTLLVLLWSVLAAIYRRGNDRAFWLGVAVFGWGYVFMCFGPWFGQWAAPPLLTTQGLVYLRARTGGTVQTPKRNNIAGQSSRWVLFGGSVVQTWDPPIVTDDCFQQAGQSIVALLFAILGGVTASVLNGRNKASEFHESESRHAGPTRDIED